MPCTLIVAVARLHSNICAVVLVPLFFVMLSWLKLALLGNCLSRCLEGICLHIQILFLGVQGYLAVSDLPLVSMDFKKSDVSTTIDSSLTMVMGDDMVKVGHTSTHTHTCPWQSSELHEQPHSPPDCLLLLSCCCDCNSFWSFVTHCLY